MKKSKSLSINSGFQSKSLLSKTLNKNSALVNLNNRSQLIPTKHTLSRSPSNNHQTVNKKLNIVNPKTFNPPKQWIDVLKMDQNKKTYSKHAPIKVRKSPSKPIANTLTVNNHTFTGIWAKTLPREDVFDDGGGGDSKYDEDDKKEDRLNIHSLFEDKQNQQANNVYAYSMTPVTN